MCWLQDLVGLVISMLLLGDFSLVLLTLLQLYSISLVDVFLVLFILPFGILLPFPVGINALFSHGPRRSAGLARLYALWNLTSFINVVSYLLNFSWLPYLILQFIYLSGWWTFPFIRVEYSNMDYIFLVLTGDLVSFVTRLLHFFVDIYITTLNRLPVKDTRAFSHGVSCKGILNFVKSLFIYLGKSNWLLISQLSGDAGTKVNGGFSQLDWFCVNYSSLNSLIGMLPIWKFKTVPCIVTILSCSGSHDVQSIYSTLTFYPFTHLFSRSITCSEYGHLE